MMHDNILLAVFPLACGDEYELVFVDNDGNHLSFDEAKATLYPDLHDDFRGPFPTANEANEACDDFVAQTPGVKFFADENGGATLV